MKIFTFKPYGAKTVQESYHKPMNCRYMSDPVEIGGKYITIEVTAYEYDTLAAFNIYEEDENGCKGNTARMIRAGLWETCPTGFAVVRENRKPYHPQDIAEAIQALYPEELTAVEFADMPGLWQSAENQDSCNPWRF